MIAQPATQKVRKKYNLQP